MCAPRYGVGKTRETTRSVQPAWLARSPSEHLEGAVPVDYADKRRQAELEKLRMEIRKMQRDMTMDALGS